MCHTAKCVICWCIAELPKISILTSGGRDFNIVQCVDCVERLKNADGDEFWDIIHNIDLEDVYQNEQNE